MNIGVVGMNWNIINRYALSKTMLDLIENYNHWRLTNFKQELSKTRILFVHLLNQNRHYKVTKRSCV